MRGQGRREISDFLMGMDSSSFAGVISGQNNRFPVLYNCRIRDFGRLPRRGTYEMVDDTDMEVASYLTADNEVYASGHFNDKVYFAAKYGASAGLLYRMDKDQGNLDWVRDYASSIPNVWDPYNLVMDGSLDRIYSIGSTFWGSILDISNNKVRSWGIPGLNVAAGVSEINAGSGSIPAPTRGGWYYFITLLRKVGAEVVAESTPTLLPGSRFTYSPGPSDHQVTWPSMPAFLPEITHVRIWRTIDGGAPSNAHFVSDHTASLGTATITKTDSAIENNATVETFDYYQPGDFLVGSLQTSPVPAKGRYVVRYKERMLIYGIDEKIYFTDNRVGAKWKGLFNAVSGFADFEDLVTCVFIHKNDIIVCTKNTTWRIIDGDFVNQKRIASNGIGILAALAPAFDPYTQQTFSLTNKGVRAWSGTNWSEDLSYFIRGDLEAATNPAGAGGSVERSIGEVINREYYLSLPGKTAWTGTSQGARIFIGFIRDDAKLSWTIDRFIKLGSEGYGYPLYSGDNKYLLLGSIMKNIGNNIPAANINTSYQEFPFGIFRLDINGVGEKNRLIKMQVENGELDWDDNRLVMVFKLPRLIHQSPNNNLRLRMIRVVSTLAVPFTTGTEIPYMDAKIRGDGDRVYQKKKLIQSKTVGNGIAFQYSSSAGSQENRARLGHNNNPLGLRAHFNPSILDAHYDDAFASGYLDVELIYTRKTALEINSISTAYIYRDKQLQAQ